MFGQIPLKDVDSSVYKDVTEGRTDGSITISLRNFVGEGIKKKLCVSKGKKLCVSKGKRLCVSKVKVMC